MFSCWIRVHSKRILPKFDSTQARSTSRSEGSLTWSWFGSAAVTLASPSCRSWCCWGCCRRPRCASPAPRHPAAATACCRQTCSLGTLKVEDCKENTVVNSFFLLSRIQAELRKRVEQEEKESENEIILQTLHMNGGVLLRFFQSIPLPSEWKHNDGKVAITLEM